jgi:hypothetical protein
MRNFYFLIKLINYCGKVRAKAQGAKASVKLRSGNECYIHEIGHVLEGHIIPATLLL